MLIIKPARKNGNNIIHLTESVKFLVEINKKRAKKIISTKRYKLSLDNLLNK